MGLIVSIIGSNLHSDEYSAAEKLKSMIENSVPESCFGEIILCVSTTLYGQKVKDVDLLVIGELSNCSLELEFNDGFGNFIKKEVEIKSLCTTVEIKSHSIDGIFRKGTDFFVKYRNRAHSVTEQSNAQKIAVMNFFYKVFSSSPYVTNLIWFTEVTRNELINLVSVSSKEMFNNLLNDTFTFKEFMQLLTWQKPPYYNKSRKIYSFEAINAESKIYDFKGVTNLFSQIKTSSGELTRKRMEEITSTAIKGKLFIPHNDKLGIIRGRAGTGKTVGLIRLALNIIDEYDARVLLLTYNKALVLDIRRLLSFTEAPDMFNEKCLAVRTIHSYFYEVINRALYNGKLSVDYFIINYEREMTRFLELVNEDIEMLNLVCDVCKGSYSLDWDYIFIDEAQDWSDTEMQVIMKLFGLNKIMIADGGSQFVRSIEVCDWSKIKEKDSSKLRICLRQKNNLIKFVNHFSYLINQYSNKILAHEKSLGGKVIIIENKAKVIEVVKQEIKCLKKEGNVPYDMLLLVTPTLVKNGEEEGFVLKKEYELNGISLWDGTISENKNDFFIDNNHARVLQYDSSRGLEGWVVVCFNFDEYLEIKEREFIDNVESSFLDTLEDKRKKSLLNWALLPLTRAIDTLVIILDNPNSYYGRMLIDTSKSYEDYTYLVK